MLASAASLSLAAAATATLPGPVQAAGAIRSAFVEAVIPSKPLSALLNACPDNTQLVGPGTGVLGVTSLTMSDNSTTASGVTFNVLAVPDGIDCASATLAQGILMFRAAARVPPLQTLQLAYPSPWVIGAGLSVPAGRHLCFGAEQLNHVGSLSVHVDRLVN